MAEVRGDLHKQGCTNSQIGIASEDLQQQMNCSASQLRKHVRRCESCTVDACEFCQLAASAYNLPLRHPWMTDFCYPRTPSFAAWLPTFQAVGQRDRNSLAHAAKGLLNIDHSKQTSVYAHTNANRMEGYSDRQLPAKATKLHAES
jgi:hypothetical protein